MEFDDDQPRCRTGRERGNDVLDCRFRGDFDPGADQPDPLGAQPHLRHRLFARNVDGALPRGRNRGGGLD